MSHEVFSRITNRSDKRNDLFLCSCCNRSSPERNTGALPLGYELNVLWTIHGSEKELVVAYFRDISWNLCGTKSIEQNPSWEANSSAASKKFPAFYSEVSLPCSQEPANEIYPEPDESGLCPMFSRSTWIVPSFLRLYLSSSPLPSDLRPEIL
jgi:hypothetical protein